MITTSVTPIGLTLPIQKGDSGFFEQSFDTFTQTKSNIVNLLRTQPGERRMQPTFGSRLWTLNFEQNVDAIGQIAERIIREDIARWVPGVEVTKVDILTLKNDQTAADRDIYRLSIKVFFTVLAVKRDDVIELVVDAGKM